MQQPLVKNSAQGHHNVREDEIATFCPVAVTDRTPANGQYRAYYAILGTDVGQMVVDLLAPRKAKNVLGHKIIKSITLFAGNAVGGLTEHERKRYATDPIVLFELVDFNNLEAAGTSAEEKETRESLWRAVQANGERIVVVREIKDRQIHSM